MVERLAVVVFNGVSLGIMSFAFGVFDMATAQGELPGLDVRVVGGEPDAALRGGGLSCPVPYDLAAVRGADLVIVPNWRSPFERPPEDLLEALRAAHARGARVAGLCSGAFVLAAAGLLDDRPATTHWGLAPLLAEQFPKVKVDASALYVDDGDVLTSGGGAAGMDLALHLIRTLCGADVAIRLAKGMVLPPHRPGGQAQYIESPIPEVPEEDPVAETMTWALSKLDTTMPVAELAQRAHMSRRNYDRRFREITGTTPATWLTHQRVIRAQRLLESTTLPVDQVARYCGFSSAAALRPHFRRLVGVAPASYRDSFGMAGSLS
ncbi:transcriptional regulator GlxA family with amidase domain [Actinocrispum wychmicini]|uniref:Transcriptional regulator GlxA family with amidase domain n=1 Tax=Actinocrispum wychmicini TaxID=1213861 RepID=A0A4R2JRM5_9PSEU|nr:transcriptional regulator GlxA family with amidase domain [Actinocrispum wychmicini]